MRIAADVMSTDLRHAVHAHVGEVPGHAEVHAAASDDLLDVIRLMVDHHIGAIPIVDDRGQVIGVITDVDALRAIADELDGEDAAVEVLEIPDDGPARAREDPARR
jgi:CBS domain-containing protein